MPSYQKSHLAAWKDVLRTWPESELGKSTIEKAYLQSKHFPSFSIETALEQLSGSITETTVSDWIGNRSSNRSASVVVLNAANIPFVGFRDLFACHLLGQRYVGVLSSRDNLLLPAICRYFEEKSGIGLTEKIEFTSLDKALKDADKLIATGSDSTIRDIRSLAIPESENVLVRGHRIGAAVLDGTESKVELKRLAKDCLQYDGRGCRSVAQLWYKNPESLVGLSESLESYRVANRPSNETVESLRVAIAFERSIGSQYFSGDGYLISKGEALAQGPCHIRATIFKDRTKWEKWKVEKANLLQFFAARNHEGYDGIEDFGSAQNPSIEWDPDGRDLIDFLIR